MHLIAPAYVPVPLPLPLLQAASTAPSQPSSKPRRRERRSTSEPSPVVPAARKRRVRPLSLPIAALRAPPRPPPSVPTFIPDPHHHIHAVAPIPLPTRSPAPTRRKHRRRKPVPPTPEPPLTDVPSLYEFNIELKRLARKRALKPCLRILGDMRKAGLSPDKYTYSTLLSCCARCGTPDVAMDLYNCMTAEGVAIDDYIRTNLLTVAANSSPPRLEMCARLFKSTRSPSRYMCNVMMDAYARLGLVDECLTTYRYMAFRSMQADKYTVSALVKALVKADRLNEAVDKIHEMHAAGLEVASAAFGQVMDAFGRQGALDKAIDLFDSMTLYGVQPTQITYNILIGACEHVSMPERAFEIYEEMKATSSFSGDRYTLHTLIKCCLRIPDGQRALDLYRTIKRATFPCNQVSYRLALTAAGQLMDLDAVMEVADDIEAHNCKPREDTAAFFVAACIRCSDLEAALKFFGDYVQRQSVEHRVVRFFNAIRDALKSFEQYGNNDQGDFEYTALVVSEFERSWQRGQ